MKIRWLKDCEIQMEDENEEDTYTCESRQAGDIDDVEIKDYGMSLTDGNKLSKDKNYPILKFNENGLVSVPVCKQWFEIME